MPSMLYVTYLVTHSYFLIHLFPMFRQWVGLSFPAYAIYVDTCRECYEAYVNFGLVMLSFLKLMIYSQ